MATSWSRRPIWKRWPHGGTVFENAYTSSPTVRAGAGVP